jgi:UDP:flavonoid glycosyltransferase YjiC (YdhE family)
MSRRLKIDLVAPPFAGHLHPILGLARILREHADIRIFSTPDAADRVTDSGFQLHPILAEHTRAVWSIPNTASPVRGRPWMLLQQFRQNLRLLPGLRREISAAWQAQPPDLAIVDFTLPSVGHWARALGIRWWTSHPSPLAIETPDGTPTYLGGWLPPKNLLGKFRDASARQTIRLFKRLMFLTHARQLRAVGLPHIYRPDGSETVYSDDVILALGSSALEFPATWPRAVHFIGPSRYTPPPRDDAPPTLDPSRKNVLVTLGTHLPYTRRQLLALLPAWAAQMPDVFFHYTTGGNTNDINSAPTSGPNWKTYRYLHYDSVIDRFDAVIHHGGAGIVYHTLHAARPAVVWPQDYDQFDFAARLAHHGLALRCRHPRQIPTALRRVLTDPAQHTRLTAFARDLQQIDQPTLLKNLLTSRGLL